MDDHSQLDEELRTLAALAGAYDAGDPGAAVPIAEALRRVFQSSPAAATPPLLARLGATYTRVASSVPKPPYPDDRFMPLVSVRVDLTAADGRVIQASTDLSTIMGSPRFSPVLGAVREFRQVQAPDWWRSEPVFVLGRSRVTRRDLALWAVSRGGGVPDGERLPQVYEQLRRGRPVYLKLTLSSGAPLDVPLDDAHPAALRQVAYEVSRSAALRNLAARGVS
jgi:hypothetical protein